MRAKRGRKGNLVWFSSTALAAVIVLAACSSGGAKSSNNATTNAAASGGSSGAASGGSAPGALPVKISLIGPPPLNESLWADVASAQGYFKAVGLTPSFKYFGHGVDVAKSVVSKSVDIGLDPTNATIQLNSKGVPLVMVAGMDNVDWIVGVTNPSVKTCADLKGQTIADDGPDNARRIFLGTMLKGCGLTLNDTKHVSIGTTPANIVKAAAAGQINASVLHTPELSEVNAESKGKTWHAVHPPKSVLNQEHYSDFAVLKSFLATPNGKTITERTIAAYILARAWIMNPANQDAFAALTAKAQGITKPVALTGIKLLAGIPFWAPGLGLGQQQITSKVKLLVAGGSVKANQAPTYNDLVDPSIYPAALELAQKAVPNNSNSQYVK